MFPFEVTVTAIRPLARGVLGLRLAAPGLPAFEAGAHVDLQLAGGRWARSYSLTNPLEAAAPGNGPPAYKVAVGLAPDSRGGSSWVHASLREGMRLPMSAPRNHFRLDDSARPVLLVAGGIGITPLWAMAQVCERQGRPWRMVAAARTRAAASFADELAALDGGRGRVRWHVDDEDGGHLDIDALRGQIEPDSALYCCGPAGLMRAVEQRLANAGATLHFEWFAAAAPAQPAAAVTDAHATQASAAQQPGADAPFDLVLSRSGQRLSVPPGRSILQVMEDAGHVIASVCQEGVCGTCETTVLQGDIDHRCQVLTDSERAEGRTMMVCVSRARSAKLVLDA